MRAELVMDDFWFWLNGCLRVFIFIVPLVRIFTMAKLPEFVDAPRVYVALSVESEHVVSSCGYLRDRCSSFLVRELDLMELVIDFTLLLVAEIGATATSWLIVTFIYASFLIFSFANSKARARIVAPAKDAAICCQQQSDLVGECNLHDEVVRHLISWLVERLKCSERFRVLLCFFYITQVGKEKVTLFGTSVIVKRDQ